MHVAIEAVGFTYPIYDEPSSIEHWKVLVANPNKFRLISESSAKNDHNDTKFLRDLLRIDYLPLAHCGTRRPGRSGSWSKDSVTYLRDEGR